MEDEHGHGHSVASWTGVAILTVASLLICIGVYFALTWATWTGIALVVLGLVAWVALESAGYGEKHGEPT